MKPDIKNYDYLCITAKSDSVDGIIASYKTLGWQLIEVREDKQYIDLDVIDFMRPHKIENKDRLQLLQVRLETALNKVGEARHKKHRKSAVIGLTGGIIGCTAIALGILFFFMQGDDMLLKIASGIASIVIGLALMTAVATTFKKLVRYENGIFAAVTSGLKADIEAICTEANRLIGNVGGKAEEEEIAGEETGK